MPQSKRHHWWPECVSEFWKDADGFVHWLLPDGQVRRATPKNLGVIGNGHFIRLGRTPGEATPWDQNFENEFQRADDGFPKIIQWLEGLDREPRVNANTPADRFLEQEASDETIRVLIEKLVSLAVRSPMNRESAVGVAESLRGPLPERDRNAIMGLNMRYAQREAVKSLKYLGKTVVVYSPDREFVFGDGFFP